MKRRTAVQKLAAVPAALASGNWLLLGRAEGPLKTAPELPDGTIHVATVISDGAVIIDFCGPWEVFQDVWVGGRHGSPDHRMPFRLYTVAERRALIRASGGMQIMPDFTFDDAPIPHVIVVPAQQGHSERMFEWLRTTHRTADITMSVCTGAFLLAASGLLAGKAATTHHEYYDRFAAAFPDVELRRERRFVDEGKVATAGGLSSGIDLALHVVERYFGRAVALQTARYLEYQGPAWSRG